jgi:hypothetical protein
MWRTAVKVPEATRLVGSVFLLLTVTSLGFSVVLYLKYRAVNKIPKSLGVTIFDRTFNVFDPFPERRRALQSYLFFFLLSPLVAFAWVFVIVFVVILPIIEGGYVGDLAIFLICLGPMMINEAAESISVADRLVKATERQTKFGQGDIYVLSLVKNTIGRLSAYYLVLTAVFAALFFAVPYTVPALMLALSQLIGLTVQTTIGIPIISPFVAALMYILFVLAVIVAARKLRAALFGFLPSHRFESEGYEAVARMIAHEH